MKTFVTFFLLFVSARSSKDSRNLKRLILESDGDIAAAIENLQNEVQRLNAKINVLQSTQSTVSGSTYVRWGASSCPGNGSTLIYAGYMAGNQWDQYGGGSNHLCLPDNPSWDKYADGTSSGSTIHGTEIEGDGQLLSSLFGANVNNEDLSCAVCKIPRASHLMIPGRATCYAGWTLEYHGYVVTSAESWKGSSEFVCLDANLDPVLHGSGNDNDHVVDVVEVQCGSPGGLSCPPYVQGRELACVVCSQ